MCTCTCIYNILYLSGKYAGHFGRDKTYHKLCEGFYWRGMKDEVRVYVKNCDKCSRVNIAPPKTAPPLNPIPVPSKVWSLVGIDIIGPMATTLKGNKYIVAATDHFSKWSTAAAIPDKTALSVAKFMIATICTYGPMDSIITDQGKEFTNKIMDELTTELDIDHRITSAYHPQSNGQRERDNRTLKEVLSKMSNKDCNDWDEHIDSALFAHRTSVHASTKHTPFEVMFGRKAKLINAPVKVDNCEFTRDAVEAIQENRRVINADVETNIEHAQKRQKKNYDARNKSHVAIEKGKLVLIKNASKIRRFGSKLAPRWLGPYEVVESLTKGRVRLRNIASGKLLANVYHCCNVKEYTATPLNKSADSAPKRMNNKNKPPGKNQQAPRNRKKLSHTTRCLLSRKKLKTARNQMTQKGLKSTKRQPTNRDQELQEHINSSMMSIPQANSLPTITPIKRRLRPAPSPVVPVVVPINYRLRRRSLLKCQKTTLKNQVRNTPQKTHNTSGFNPPNKNQCKKMCEKIQTCFIRRPKYKSTSGVASRPTQTHKVRGDGNCFFRAISYAVSGSEDTHVECRNVGMWLFNTWLPNQCQIHWKDI